MLGQDAVPDRANGIPIRFVNHTLTIRARSEGQTEGALRFDRRFCMFVRIR